MLNMKKNDSQSMKENRVKMLLGVAKTVYKTGPLRDNREAIAAFLNGEEVYYCDGSLLNSSIFDNEDYQRFG